MADFFRHGYQISHLFLIDNVENIGLPRADIVIGGCYLIIFGDRPAHRAELALEWIGDQNTNTMAMKASRQCQCLGESSNCKKCRSVHDLKPILPLCINMFTVFVSNNLYITLLRLQAVSQNMAPPPLFQF